MGTHVVIEHIEKRIKWMYWPHSQYAAKPTSWKSMHKMWIRSKRTVEETMDRRCCRDTRQHKLTAAQAHSRPGSQPPRLTAAQAHSRPGSQPPRLTAAQAHSRPDSQPPRLTAAQAHSRPGSQPPRLTAAQAHSRPGLPRCC